MYSDQDKKYLRQIYRSFSKYKKYLPCIVLCLAGSSLTTFLQPLVIQQITDQGMIKKDLNRIVIFSIILFCLSLIQLSLSLLQTHIFSDIHNDFTHSLYEQSYWKLSRLKQSYYEEEDGAGITNVLNTDINNIASVADQITTFSILSFLQIVGGMIGLAILDYKLAILIIVIIPIKLIIVSYYSKKKKLVFETWIKNNHSFYKWLGECIDGIREMKLWNMFYVKNKKYEELQQNIMNSYKKNTMLDEYRTLSAELLDVVLNTMLYILSGIMIVNEKLTIGGAFAFITYSKYVVTPITFLSNMKYYFAQIKPSVKRFLDFMDQPEEENYANKDTEAYSDEKEISDAIIEFKNVSFSYVENKQVLKDLSLCVTRGEHIAIVGENGSGKTTVFNLLSGFCFPIKGDIIVDGISVKRMKSDELRDKIAVVPQKPYLFQGTIEENVNLDGNASKEEIVRACEISGAATFINKLEKGYQEMIGHNGTKLSGGERQKIAVARALIKKSNILLLDEATEGYDAESNEWLYNILKSNIENKTIILITHHEQEMKGIDKVYLLSDGKLERL
mgnify:CR=1 FL=1